MTVNAQTIEALKSAGHYFAAGALARQLKLLPNYGCHYGARSEVEFARSEYRRGFEAACRY